MTEDCGDPFGVPFEKGTAQCGETLGFCVPGGFRNEEREQGPVIEQKRILRLILLSPLVHRHGHNDRPVFRQGREQFFQRMIHQIRDGHEGTCLLFGFLYELFRRKRFRDEFRFCIRGGT